jgi:hypothetical protein
MCREPTDLNGGEVIINNSGYKLVSGNHGINFEFGYEDQPVALITEVEILEYCKQKRAVAIADILYIEHLQSKIRIDVTDEENNVIAVINPNGAGKNI